MIVTYCAAKEENWEVATYLNLVAALQYILAVTKHNAEYLFYDACLNT